MLPQVLLLDVGGAAGRGPAWIPTATAIMTVGGFRRSWRRMSLGVLACCPAAEPEELPLGVGRRQLAARSVGGRGLAVAAESAQQVGPGGVEEVVVVQVQPVDQRQRGGGAVRPRPTATARLSATTGVGATASSWS